MDYDDLAALMERELEELGDSDLENDVEDQNNDALHQLLLARKKELGVINGTPISVEGLETSTIANNTEDIEDDEEWKALLHSSEIMSKIGHRAEESEHYIPRDAFPEGHDENRAFAKKVAILSDSVIALLITPRTPRQEEDKKKEGSSDAEEEEEDIATTSRPMDGKEEGDATIPAALLAIQGDDNTIDSPTKQSERLASDTAISVVDVVPASVATFIPGQPITTEESEILRDVLSLMIESVERTAPMVQQKALLPASSSIKVTQLEIYEITGDEDDGNVPEPTQDLIDEYTSFQQFPVSLSENTEKHTETSYEEMMRIEQKLMEQQLEADRLERVERQKQRERERQLMIRYNAAVSFSFLPHPLV